MQDSGEPCIESAEQAIGYRFQNTCLLVKALTHASITDARVDSNERLEFLGDSVLGLVTSERIFSLFPNLLEGEMTKIKSTAVSRRTCADIADAMVVGRLFEVLLRENVVIVTTSNRVPDDLYKDGLNRQLFLPFIDLIKERLVVHELTSHRDYRQDRLTGGNVYFTPADAEARKAMDAVWKDLTGGGTAEPLILNVKNRAVEIPA